MLKVDNNDLVKEIMVRTQFKHSIEQVEQIIDLYIDEILEGTNEADIDKIFNKLVERFIEKLS